MTASPAFPPEISYELPGWNLAWFRLLPTGQGQAELERLRRQVAERVAADFAASEISSEPVVQAVRRLFRAAGCDPTRYRPSSESLLRRVLKDGALPSLHPLVDANNLLSMILRVPCCVVDAAAVRPPFVLRAGAAGEDMLSMRGPFNLEGKPVLVDGEGPFGTPITDSERVKIKREPNEAWMVAYLVEGVCPRAAAASALEGILAAAPVARLA